MERVVLIAFFLTMTLKLMPMTVEVSDKKANTEMMKIVEAKIIMQRRKYQRQQWYLDMMEEDVVNGNFSVFGVCGGNQGRKLWKMIVLLYVFPSYLHFLQLFF